MNDKIINPLNGHVLELNSSNALDLINKYISIITNNNIQSGGETQKSQKPQKPKKTIKKKQKNQDIDLNQITIKKKNKNSTCILNEYFVYYDKKTNKNIELCKIKFLSQGSNGKVYLFTEKPKTMNKKPQYKIVVKTFFNKNSDEIKIIEYLEKNKIDCNLINARLLKIPNNEYITIMNFMEGDLENLLGKLKDPDIQNIINKVLNTLQCLLKQDLVYIDLKLQNILYKYDENKNIDVCIGDIGGICKKNTTYNDDFGPFYTYLPWEYRNNYNEVKCCEPVLVWTVGILIIQLLINNYEDSRNLNNLFHWSVMNELTTEQDDNKFKKNLSNLLKKYEKKCPLLHSIFNLDPKKRPTINKLIEENKKNKLLNLS